MTDAAKEMLEPCPFCGAGSKFVGVGASQEMHGDEYITEGRRWSVICGKCGSSCSLHCPSEQEAIEAWNTRTAASAPSQAIVAVGVRDLGDHTPTPWEFDGNCGGYISQGGEKIARAYSNRDAAFIVKAVNAVSALPAPEPQRGTGTGG
jgi:hypothetical protein